jgi:hypothetical protein
MQPAAAISGLYFSNLQAAYFGRGRIGRYQVEDYARRKGRTVYEVERWSAPLRPGCARPSTCPLASDCCVGWPTSAKANRCLSLSKAMACPGAGSLITLEAEPVEGCRSRAPHPELPVLSPVEGCQMRRLALEYKIEKTPET